MRSLLVAAAIALAGGWASAQPIEPGLTTSSADFTKAKTVEVDLSSFDFTPSLIQLEAGKPYVLKIVNTAKKGGHNFSAAKFFAAAAVSPQDAAKIAGGKIELRRGETASIHLVPTAGTFKLTCTHFGHSILGMTGRIVVR